MTHIAACTRRGFLQAATVASMLPMAAAPRLRSSQVTDAAAWSPRYGPAVVVFEDRLWVMGGTTNLHNGSQLNDVWSSGDGIHWRRELASAPWPPRWVPAVFAFRGKLWIIGGLASVEPIRNHNDIWSSPDGKRWTLEVPDAPWTARHVWATAIHRERMFLLGGATDGSHYYQDALSSEDGRNWSAAPITSPWFEKRKNLAAASFHGRLFVSGGSLIEPSPRLLNDIWSSPDGNRWERCTPAARWSPRTFHTLVEYRHRLWMVGGELGGGHYSNDVWSSGDGVGWTLETDQLPWLGRHAGGVVVFRDKVWVLGGTSSSWGTSSRNDVWALEGEPAVALGGSGHASSNASALPQNRSTSGIASAE